jgi:hypothetical protein
MIEGQHAYVGFINADDLVLAYDDDNICKLQMPLKP